MCFYLEHGSHHGARPAEIDAPQPQRGSIRGTVTDVDDAAIPGATLTVDGPAGSEHRTLNSDETGSFEFKDLAPAVAYKITVSAKGFADFTSPAIVLTPGQTLEMADIKLKISVVETTVAAVTVEQLATRQVKLPAVRPSSSPPNKLRQKRNSESLALFPTILLSMTRIRCR